MHNDGHKINKKQWDSEHKYLIWATWRPDSIQWFSTLPNIGIIWGVLNITDAWALPLEGAGSTSGIRCQYVLNPYPTCP